MLLILLLIVVGGTSNCQEINFQPGAGGVFWAMNCDFYGGDIGNSAVPGEQCGELCISNRQCTHFTWYQGVCYIKRLTNSPVATPLSGAVCGWFERNSGPIKGTYWAEQSDAGGCQMPGNANYALTDAIALGQQPQLGNLVFRSGLCGQVVTVNCGNGPIDAVVASTCNINSPSCGVDMIGKTWRAATNNKPPGEAQCSVSLSNRNPIQGGAPLCFHRPYSDLGNLYYVAIGVFNTNGRVSSSATVAGIQGTRGNDEWFQFNSDGLFNENAAVIFYFEDGSSANFQLRNCPSGGNPFIFQ